MGGGQEVNASIDFRRTQQGDFTVCTNQGRGGSGRNNAQWLCAAFDDACTCTEACAIGSTIGYYARVVKCQNEENPGVSSRQTFSNEHGCFKWRIGSGRQKQI